MWTVFRAAGIFSFDFSAGLAGHYQYLYSFQPAKAGETGYTLASYQALLKDPFFKTTFWNTAVFVFFSVGCHMI